VRGVPSPQTGLPLFFFFLRTVWFFFSALNFSLLDLWPRWTRGPFQAPYHFRLLALVLACGLFFFDAVFDFFYKCQPLAGRRTSAILRSPPSRPFYVFVCRTDRGGFFFDTCPPPCLEAFGPDEFSLSRTSVWGVCGFTTSLTTVFFPKALFW